MARGKAVTTTLEALEKAVVESKRRERELAEAAQAAEQEFAEAKRRLAEAEPGIAIDGSPPNDQKGKAAWAEFGKARERYEAPWLERAQLARSRTERAESQRDAFVAEHLAELLEEVEPAAYASVERVRSTLTAALEAIDEVAAIEARATYLLRPVPGLDGRDVPRQPTDALRAEIRQALAGELPAPLPRSLYPDEPESIEAGRGLGTVGPAD